MNEQTPQDALAELSKLDAMIAADDPDFFKSQEQETAGDTTPKDEPRELAPAEPAADSGKQTDQQKQDEQQAPDPVDQADKDDPTLSPYERIKRKEARTWQRIQKKDAAQAEKDAKLAAREAALEERERKLQSSQPAPAPEPTSSDQIKIDRNLLLASMEKWKAEGRSDLLELGQKELEAMDRNEARQNSQRAAAPQIPAPTRDPAIEKATAQSWEKAKVDYPDIMAPGSPLNVEFRKFHQANPDIFEHPKAPILVAEFVDAKLRAARLPELTATIQKLQNELQDLRTRTSIPSGGSGPDRNPRRFSDLSLAEQEAELEREIGGR